jgi:hypothetical protein
MKYDPFTHIKIGSPPNLQMNSIIFLVISGKYPTFAILIN